MTKEILIKKADLLMEAICLICEKDERKVLLPMVDDLIIEALKHEKV